MRLAQFVTTGLALGLAVAGWFAACTPGHASAGRAVPVVPVESGVEATRDKPPCPPEMAFVERTYCIDRWEASVVLVTDRGERPYSPYKPITGEMIRAVSRRGVVPQAYVSRDDAAVACAGAGKRLCKADEWVLACRGAHPKKFPYGYLRRPGICNDTGRVSPLKSLYSHLGAKMYSHDPMNDPRLNTLPGTLAKTGSHPDCVSDYGVYDMVGNLHEWVDEAQSSFRGGYYLDTHINGDGCDYRTTAHAPDYHDYSTGFRCCADLNSVP